MKVLLVLITIILLSGCTESTSTSKKPEDENQVAPPTGSIPVSMFNESRFNESVFK